MSHMVYDKYDKPKDALRASGERRLCEYFICFLLYSFLGWVYEVFLEVVIYRWGYSDRGVLFGPYCIVYGFGACFLIFLLSGLRKRKLLLDVPGFKISVIPFIVFLAIVIITTLTELCASYIMEFTHGNWLWDYRRFAFNFEGRIALNPSIRFGIGGMVILYVIQPFFERLLSGPSDRRLRVIFTVLAVIFAADVIIFLLNLLFNI